jgi:hypothetical protein
LLSSTSPQALSLAELKPKDPQDPKLLLSAQNASDASAPSSAPMSAAKTPGTGLLIDTSA